MRSIKKFFSFLISSGKGALLLFALMAAAGFFLLWCSVKLPPNSDLGKLLDKTGNIVLAAALVQLLIRTWLWKSAVEALYQRVVVRESIILAGLTDLGWMADIPLKETFANATSFKAYGISLSTWSGGTEQELLRDVLRRKGTIDLYIVNPENWNLMKVIGDLFGETPAERAKKIRTSIQQFEAMAKSENGQDRLKIYIINILPRHSGYSLDDKIYAVSIHRTERGKNPGGTPVLVFSREGTLHQRFWSREIKNLEKNSKLLT